MQKKRAEECLDAAMAVGTAILEYGGEVSRVEDSIKRIGAAFGFARTDVFCITSVIITTAYYSDHEFCTQERRITHTENNFDKLSQVNALSRTICFLHKDPDDVIAALESIQRQESASFPVQILVHALIPASFTVFFGGNAADMVISGLIGTLLLCMSKRLTDARLSALFIALLCSVAGGFLANSLSWGIAACHAALISIGNVMVFIPGVKFTNSIRDLLIGETITGLICLAESLLMAVIVAVGFAASSLLIYSR